MGNHMMRIGLCGLALAAMWAFSPITDKADKYPQGYFTSPVPFALYLSGTFGELRSGHFHSGIDIKSPDGRVGHPVRAAAAGTVVRIKVSASGYGRALYLRHPNGYTTVYAHLHRFAEPIEEWVKTQQYRRESFEVDLYPEAGRFTFQKGERLGLMGNSGSSSGPHLHFEVRDTRTQEPINPILFGLEVADHTPPRMRQFKVYALDDKLQVIGEQLFGLRKRGKYYRLAQDTLVVGAWRVGFGLKVYDHHDHVPNSNGIYGLRMYVDDSLWYAFEMERFSFAQTRYLNAHVDYAAYVRDKGWFNRTWLLPGNRLKAYPHISGSRGALPLYRHRPARVRLVAEDPWGNASELVFWIRRGEVAPPPPRLYNFHIDWAKGGTIRLDGLRLHFPKGALYEDLYLQCDVQNDTEPTHYAHLYRLASAEVPVHRWSRLAIAPARPIPAHLRNKAFVGWLDEQGRLVSCGGSWQPDGMLHTHIRQLGSFTIGIDEVAPTIEPVSFVRDMRGRRTMRFRITDNLPVTGKAQGLRYRATVDGRWILMEYDAKKDLLIHHFDGRIGPGEHLLRIEVTDDRGNRTVWESTFIR